MASTGNDASADENRNSLNTAGGALGGAATAQTKPRAGPGATTTAIAAGEASDAAAAAAAAAATDPAVGSDVGGDDAMSTTTDQTNEWPSERVLADAAWRKQRAREPGGRAPCEVCGRRFAVDRLFTHQTICAKLRRRSASGRGPGWAWG